ELHGSRQKGSGRVRQPDSVADPISNPLLQLATAMDALARELDSEEEQIEYTAVALRCQTQATGLGQWLGQELPNQVYWVEVSGEDNRRVTLASAPIEVGTE